MKIVFERQKLRGWVTLQKRRRGRGRLKARSKWRLTGCGEAESSSARGDKNQGNDVRRGKICEAMDGIKIGLDTCRFAVIS